MSIDSLIADLDASIDRAGGPPGPVPVQQILTAAQQDSALVNTRDAEYLRARILALPPADRDYVVARLSRGLPAVVRYPVGQNGVLKTVAFLPTIDLGQTYEGVTPVAPTGAGAPIPREAALAYNVQIPPVAGSSTDAILEKARQNAAKLHGSNAISNVGRGAAAFTRAGAELIRTSAHALRHPNGASGQYHEGLEQASQNGAVEEMLNWQHVRPAGAWGRRLFGSGGSRGSRGSGGF